MNLSPLKKEFEIKVAPVPALRVIGLKIRTSLAAAPQDCPKLWRESFAPRMKEVTGFNGTAYGVSVMVDCEAMIFDYLAAVPAAPDAALPSGMEAMSLSGGFYAQCKVESLANVSAAYKFVYGPWLAEQTGWELDLTAPCYEFYPAEYLENNVFYIYVKVNEKK